MVKQLFQDFFSSSTSQYASQSEIEQQCPDLEDLAWDMELEMKPPVAREKQESEMTRSLKSAQRSQRSFKSRLFERVLRPALRGICLVTCCIGCPQDTFFKKHDMQIRKSEEDEVVLRIINGEEQAEPETDEDWEAVSEASYTSWSEERRSPVVPVTKRSEPSESELKTTYYEEEDKEESNSEKRQATECNTLLIGPSKGFKRSSRKSLLCNTGEDVICDKHSPARSKNLFGTLKFKDDSPPEWDSDAFRCDSLPTVSKPDVVSADDMLSSDWNP